MSLIDSLIEVAVQKVCDDSLRINASNANTVGIEARVTRTYDGVGVHRHKDACQWCLSRCGNDMSYTEALNKGAFQRHPGCGCVIEYISKKGERTYQAGKSTSDNWISEAEFQKRVNYGVADRIITPQERSMNAAIEMQVRDKASKTLVNAIIDNHEALQYYSPEDMLRRLERAGYKILPLSKSNTGFNDLSFEEGGGYKILFGGDGVFRYHPQGGRHKIDYWTVSNSVKGKHQYDMEGREVFFNKGIV